MCFLNTQQLKISSGRRINWQASFTSWMSALHWLGTKLGGAASSRIQTCWVSLSPRSKATYQVTHQGHSKLYLLAQKGLHLVFWKIHQYVMLILKFFWKQRDHNWNSNYFLDWAKPTRQWEWMAVGRWTSTSLLEMGIRCVFFLYII